MKQEQKDLLLKDLCARLPYRVKCVSGVDDTTLVINGINPECCGASEVQVTYERSRINFDTTISAIKLYLFPLSSMNEEQLLELTSISFENSIDSSIKTLNWCYKNHLDINNLIPMGLAIDCTNLNIY